MTEEVRRVSGPESAEATPGMEAILDRKRMDATVGAMEAISSMLPYGGGLSIEDTDDSRERVLRALGVLLLPSPGPTPLQAMLDRMSPFIENVAQAYITMAASPGGAMGVAIGEPPIGGCFGCAQGRQGRTVVTPPPMTEPPGADVGIEDIDAMSANFGALKNEALELFLRRLSGERLRRMGISSPVEPQTVVG